MTGLWTAVALLTVALFVSCAAPHLARAHWPARAPGLGVLAWQCLSLSLVLSLALAGIALVIPQLPATTSLAELAHLCTTVLMVQLQRPETAALTGTGLVVVSAISARFCCLFVRGQLRSHRRRRRQLAALVLAGELHSDGSTVVEHQTPAVYCLPGRNSRIVVTTGATAVLSSVELGYVLAHERAHLRLRHDLARATALALSRTFRGVHCFQLAAHQIARLTEMQADDAAGVAARPHLARALLHLAHGPTGSLNAGGVTIDRARRLLTPAPPLPRPQRALVAMVGFAAVVTPVALGLLPGASVVGEQCCSVTGDSSHRWDLAGRH